MSGEILILGASARAAAFSARRAGLSPWCVDLFADSDLRAVCPALRSRGPYPNAFLDEHRFAPSMPWMYTGAMENHAFLVGQLADLRSLWGNDSGVLTWARDPDWLAVQARAVGLPSPRKGTWPPGPGRWLVKPHRSAGGLGIRAWGDDLPARNPGPWLVQEFIEGIPLGAVFCGPVLLGVSRQLVGAPWLNAPGYRYAGSVGPVPVPARVEALGQRIARAGVRGLFGIDGILREDVFHPLEINPRYTASIEVLEHASGLRAMAHHAAAFGVGKAPPVPPPSRCVGKGIFYAERDLVFPEDGPWRGATGDPPPFADIPDPREPISVGTPVLTMLATGADEEACLAHLRLMAQDMNQALGGQGRGRSSSSTSIRTSDDEQYRPSPRSGN